MSLYLSYNLEIKNEKFLCVNWSNTDIPVLAASTDKNKITFFQDEAINISEHDMIKDGRITALDWHPSDMILAYGYQDGRVGVWIDEENFNKEENSVHEAKISIIKFNTTGKRVVSADEKGCICVWRFENSLYKLCIYKQNYNIEDIFFPKFSYEKHEQNSKFPSQEKLNTLFFFCNSGGMLYLADDANSSPEICRVGGKIKSLLFYEKDNSIILITSHMLLVKCRIYFNQQLTPKKIKLSIAGNPENIKTVWAGLGLLAMVSGDDLIRFFYVETEQAYFLSMSDHEVGKIYVEDIFNCIDYSFRKRILIAGTSKGKVYMWKCNLTSSIIPVSPESWEAYCIVDTLPNILDIKWSNYMGLIHVVNKSNSHAMLSETILQKKMNSNIKVIQISHKTLEIIFDNSTGAIDKNKVKKVETGETIKGMDLYKNTLLTWNGTNAFIYDISIDNMSLSKLHNLNIKSNLLTLNDDSVIVGNGKSIDIYSFEGELKNKINIDTIYGEISHFNVNNKYLLVITSSNFFGIYDISRRTLKQIMNFRKFEKNKQSLGEIREGSINCKGNYIGLLCDSLENQEIHIPETIFYVYDVELDSFTEHEISPNRIPIEFIWDFCDPRLFGVQTEYAKDLSEENYINNEEKKKKEWYGSEFFIFFYTSEYGIKKQESHRINRDIQGIFALCIPSIYFIISNTSNDEKVHSLLEKKFQFFQGLDKVDDNIKNSLIDFSILMSSGKLDEAYKIVKNIKNPSIWENMAMICIKTKRLDVLEICLSNMRFSRGIRALREAKYEKETEAKLAIVAMHLGLIEDAKSLLQECGRWDLLIKFNISIGDYEKAIEISSKNERINLKNSYYRIAQNFEKSNQIESAIEYYKLSGTHHREIPRMLIQKNKMDILEEFINKETDSEFYIWWASYQERNDNIDQALLYYKKANDYSNIVRILIASNEIDEAKKICKETKDRGACFLLGRAMEDNNDIKSAIYYYGMSMRINQAFRLAKEHNLDAEIYNLGLQAPQATKNTIAEYFERKNDYIKSAKLYQLAGNIKNALNICLISQQYDLIREIADNVEYKNDPETLRSLAEYFVDQGHDDKALGTYIRLKDYDNALKLCEAKNLRISPETADAIFDELDIKTENDSKKKLLKKLAKQLTTQGDFELAHQKYVQMGNLKKAMKCLIKLGDKDKVIYFANTSRFSDNYILAANFLQSLDWNDNPDIIKLIVTFLKKAKAYDNLSNFYCLCATVEINDYRNYEKALEALNEARVVLKHEIAKDLTEEDKHRILTKDEELEKRITLTKLFLHTCSIRKNQAQEALKECTELLSIPGIDNIVREGDIYNIMIEVYWEEKEYENAYHVLEVMKARKKMLTNYVDPKEIAKICEAVGKSNIFTKDNNNYNSVPEEDDIN